MQKKLIKNHFDCSRFVHNLALETKINAYKSAKINLTAFDLIRQLTDLKQDCKWLYEVSNKSLQQAIMCLDTAYKNFFKFKKNFPKFKTKQGKQSFQICAYVKTNKIDFERKKLTILKIRNIKINIDREFKEKIKAVTISKTPTNKYYASILIDTGIKQPKNPKVKKCTTIGIDLGLSHFIITSEGIKVDNPRYLRQAMGRLKVLQRRSSKKVKGGQNRKKANLQVALQHEKITNKRMDFLHKLSTELIRDNQTICVENLSVSNMVKNHKLAQAITDVSWSKFIELLKYKANWYGKNLIQINKFEPTTKTCNNCGFVNEKLTLKDRNWQCNVCGKKHDRDINAAINIKVAGLKLAKSGQGLPVAPVELPTIVGAVKQECNYL